ncbi:MAG: sigma 54-interacting transcriptional regulator, partial [Hyphomicrobium sp.]
AIDCLANQPDGMPPAELHALMGRNFADVADAKWQDSVVTNERSGASERLGIVRFQGRDTPFFATMRLPKSQSRIFPAASPKATAQPERAGRSVANRFIGLDALAGNDPTMRAYVDTVRRMADWRLPVLLQGETGTGKEEFARAIHATGSRAAKPFVAIDCSSIPEALIESELFGYEPGTFTGARRDGRNGRILDANGGTLFLDEIGDMPLALQTRLLRVLALNEITPLGGSKTIPVDFALISASHQKLSQMIAQGRFRQDLYYRIAGIRFILPALRERQDKTDCILNALTIEAGLSVGLSSSGRSPGLSHQALGLLAACPWPGNMRELRLVLRYALAASGGNEIGIAHLPAWLEHSEPGSQPHAPVDVLPSRTAHMPQLPSVSLEERLAEVLARHNWCISDAAGELDVSRQTMYRWLKKCGIERPPPS